MKKINQYYKIFCFMNYDVITNNVSLLNNFVYKLKLI